MILLLLFGAALSLVMTVLAVPARATVTSTVSASILTVASDGADSIRISCGADGDVKVNDQDPAGEPDSCGSITQIQVGATGSFANDIDLSGVSEPPFNSLQTIAVDAGEGNDTVTGGPLPEEIDGAGGNDLLRGGGGADDLDGDAGGDTLAGGEGNDTVTDGDPSGTDELSGGAGNDSLTGGLGVERVVQAADVDQILTDDILRGLGDDSLQAMDQARLTGGESDNDLDASAFTEGPVVLEGLGGRDLLRGGSGDDTLRGGSGSDTYAFPNPGFGTDTIQELGICNERDEVSFARLAAGGIFDLSRATAQDFAGGRVALGSDAAVENVRGASGPDTLIGNACQNEMFGGGEGDTLRGQAGDDTLLGQDGVDALEGGEGADIVAQTADADQALFDDRLTGEGPDTISGIERASLAGGAGANRIEAVAFTLGPVSLFGGPGNDTILATRFADVLQGQGGTDTLDGGDGSDRADGGEGEDVLAGGRGKDQLTGSLGGDRLRGGRGKDRLAARDGARDVASGGPGRDRASADPVDVLRGIERGGRRRG